MRKVLLLLVYSLTLLGCKSSSDKSLECPIKGEFIIADYYGAQYWYYHVTNISDKNVNTRFDLINSNGSFTYDLQLPPKGNYYIGPNYYWNWQVGDIIEFKIAEKTYKDQFQIELQNSEPTFTGNKFTKYKCNVGGCLCRKYEKKSTFNSDCNNCGHRKDEHDDN